MGSRHEPVDFGWRSVVKKILIAAILALGLVGRPVKAGVFYSNTFDGSSTTLKMAGRFNMYNPFSTSTLALNIDSGQGLFSWLYGISAATATFTGTGNTVYSVTTSSGISVSAGGITAPFFSGNFFGDVTGRFLGSTLVNAVTELSTFTVNGIDGSGFSVLTSSSIKLTAGCIYFGANAQCVAAGNGTGDAVKAGNNIFTGSDTFQSTVTFSATSTVTFSGAVAGTVNNSSGTFLPPNTSNLSNSTFGICVVGSTVTFTTRATGKHWISANISIRQSNAGDHIQCGVLQNGALFEQQTSARGLAVIHGQGAPSWSELTINYLTQNTYAAGTYSYCLVCDINANSYQVCSNADSTANQTCTFNVSEFK